MVNLTDYFNRISTEDFVVVAFTPLERARQEVEQAKHPVGRSKKRPLEVSDAQGDKESV